MERKQRVHITVERHQVLVVRKRQRSPQAWCAACAEWVRMLTPEGAAALSGVSARLIYRRLEAGGLHFRESPEGALLICLNSLLQ